jgi:hypothetical protein
MGDDDATTTTVELMCTVHHRVRWRSPPRRYDVDAFVLLPPEQKFLEKSVLAFFAARKEGTTEQASKIYS